MWVKQDQSYSILSMRLILHQTNDKGYGVYSNTPNTKLGANRGNDVFRSTLTGCRRARGVCPCSNGSRTGPCTSLDCSSRVCRSNSLRVIRSRGNDRGVSWKERKCVRIGSTCETSRIGGVWERRRSRKSWRKLTWVVPRACIAINWEWWNTLATGIVIENRAVVRGRLVIAKLEAFDH